MPPRETIWQLAPHTGAKHSILKRYLGAWFPKLAWARRLVFIDGFAGPGEYVGGAPGSPIIALNAAATHKANLAACELIFVFIEEDNARYEHLKALIEEKAPLPANIKIRVSHGTFLDDVDGLLKPIEEANHNLAPALVMIDPFGPKGLPYLLVKRIIAQPRSEVIISLMYESIARFLRSPEFEPHLDDLFGTPEWRAASELNNPADRREYLLNLYIAQLREAGLTYTRTFELKDQGNRTEYFIVYGTKHMEGMRAMKDAMWNVDPSGQYQFSDATDRNQSTLFKAEPDFDHLKALIVGKFKGAAEIDMATLERFVLLETPFRETHYKTRILKQMEKAGELIVVDSGRKQAYAYPNGTILRFV